VRSPSRTAERIPAPVLVLASISSVQFGSAIARRLFDSLGAGGVTFLRLVLSALILLALTRPDVRRWDRQAWTAAILLGAAMAGMNQVFYLAIRTVPLGIAVTVEFTGPLLMALVQTRRWVDLVWALLAGGGVVLLGVGSGSGAAITGLALALLAGLFWAAYILLSARVGRFLPGVQGLGVALAVAAVLDAPFGAPGAAVVRHRPILLLGGLAVALLSSVFSYGLEMTALRRIPTRVFGVLMSVEPAAAAIAGWLVLGQRLGPRQLAALLMVTLASAGVTLARRERTPPEPVLAPESEQIDRAGPMAPVTPIAP
jgi:inner membrane transporter RhtA